MRQGHVPLIPIGFLPVRGHLEAQSWVVNRLGGGGRKSEPTNLKAGLPVGLPPLTYLSTLAAMRATIFAHIA